MINISNKKHNKIHIQHWHIITACLIVYDIVAVAVSYFGALILRFDMRYSQIPSEYYEPYAKFIPIYIVICIAVFALLKLYKSVWRFASYAELRRVILATVVTGITHIVLITTIFKRMPVSYFIMGITLQFILILGIRFAYRFILLLRSNRVDDFSKGKRVMCIGAGRAGQMVVREIKVSKNMHEIPVCIIDDNPNKWGRYIEGVRIIGGRDRILEAVKKFSIEKIYFTVPSASMKDRRNILNICKESGCELKSLPGIYQIANGDVSLSKMRDVDIEDLLGRDPIKVNMNEIFKHIKDKVILVTGGGGSIGSELCRQIANNSPKQLIIFDIYENNAYEIQQEIQKNCPDVNLVTLIGSVRDNRRIFQVFDKYNPDIVFHAAAHKHVPLMEESPCEAIKNNTIGTYNTAFAAMMHNCGRFVLISTDKAVNPTSCMGATKRSCEMVIQALDYMVKNGKADKAPQLFRNPALKEWANTPEKLERLRSSKTEFVAVRFGNVLGSNGSVIPLFKKQILEGGPVTVTHPDIIRYFMTIPEAVSLILEAGEYAKSGEIFVLDMGEAVKIDDLARNLIRLSGHIPDEDIKIEYTGLRPGEKLFEEKLMAEEGLKRTENDLIHIGQPIVFDYEEFLSTLEPLMDLAYKNKNNIKQMLSGIVMTYNITNN